MSLVQELVDGASGDVPVTSLLRKVKVVAARAEVPALDEWVQHELAGYRGDVELPDYRGPFETEVLGMFGGAFGSALKNAPIPSVAFPSEFRDGVLFNIAFPQPIAEIEELSQAQHGLTAPWPANAVAVVNGLIASGKMSPSRSGLRSGTRIAPRTASRRSAHHSQVTGRNGLSSGVRRGVA